MAHKLVYSDGSSFFVSDRRILEYVEALRDLAAKTNGAAKAKFQALLDEVVSLPLVRRALPAESAWPITPEMRKTVAHSLVDLASSGDSSLARIAAAKALISADSMNAKRQRPQDAVDETPVIHVTDAEVQRTIEAGARMALRTAIDAKHHSPRPG